MFYAYNTSDDVVNERSHQFNGLAFEFALYSLKIYIIINIIKNIIVL